MEDMTGDCGKEAKSEAEPLRKITIGITKLRIREPKKTSHRLLSKLDGETAAPKRVACDIGANACVGKVGEGTQEAEDFPSNSEISARMEKA